MRKSNIFFFLAFHLLFSSLYAEKFIPATDKNIHYVGRTWKENGTVNLTWPGSSLEGRFTGNSLQLVLAETTNNSIYYKIDKNDWVALNDLGEKTIINLTPDKVRNSTHEFRILKKTEGYFGPLRIKGLLVQEDAKLLPLNKRREKKIEFIGDSITAGFAVYGRPNATNNDALVIYGFQAGENLNAEVWITAVSGVGISHNYGTSKEEGTMPQRYKRLDFSNETSITDFNSWQPDIVVINLGTNDHSAPCDTTLFETRFNSFLTELRDLHPQSWILVLRPFNGYFADNEKKIVDEKYKAVDHKIELINTTGWLTAPEDYTDGTHPNSQGHRKAADKLTPILKNYLN